MTNDELFHELSERLRSIESRLFGQHEDKTMLIQEVRTRVDRLFATALDRWQNYLPFNGRYLRQTRDIILRNLDSTKDQFAAFFESGNFDGLVDFIVLTARGNFPFFMRPFSGMFLSFFASWMKSNRKLFADGIGALVSEAK